MPEQIRIKRRQLQRLVAEGLGLDSRFERIWGPQVASMGHEGDLMRLPEDIAEQESLQNGSYAPTHLFGLSSWGGSDPFG